MLTSLLTAMGLVFVLALWHATLVRFAGEPGWARTVVRALLACVTLVQAVAFVAVQSITQDVQLDRIQHVLSQVQSWTDLADGSSLVLLGLCALTLAGFTVRRLVRGPIGVRPSESGDAADRSPGP